MGYLKGKEQLNDLSDDQLSIKEFVDPFTGETGKKEANKQKPFRGSQENCAVGRLFDEPIGSARSCPKGLSANHQHGRWL